jgi:hypothetical protein
VGVLNASAAICATSCVCSPIVCATSYAKIGSVKLYNYSDTRLEICGTGDNSLRMGPANDNGWAYMISQNNANGFYFYTNQGAFQFDDAHLRGYNDGEVDIGVSGGRFRCGNFSSTVTASVLCATTCAQVTNRFKIVNGSNQINIGQWDGARHRIEADANLPLFITSYQGGIFFGISGSCHLALTAACLCSANIICAASCVRAPAVYGTTWVCSAGRMHADTCVQSPIVCATSCVKGGYIHSDGLLYAGTCVCSSIICGISQVKGGVVCGTACVQSPIVCVTSCIRTGMLCVHGCSTIGSGGMPQVAGGESVTLRGYSIQYDTGGSGCRLSNSGFLTFWSGGNWTGSERRWAMTNAWQVGSGTLAGNLAFLLGGYNVTPLLGNGGGLCTGTTVAMYISRDKYLCVYGCVESPIVCGTTCVASNCIAGLWVTGTIQVTSDVFCSTGCVRTPNIQLLGNLNVENNGNICVLTGGCIKAPIVCATTCVRASQLCTTGELYISNWVRPAANAGTYWVNASAMHLYPAWSNGCLLLRSSATTTALVLSTSNSVVKQGAFYAESDGEVGILTCGMSWALRVSQASHMALCYRTYIGNCVCSPVVCATTALRGTHCGNGAGLTSLNASNLSSGTVATARLPAAALCSYTLASLGYTGATNANYITNNSQLSNSCGYTTCTGNITGGGFTLTGDIVSNARSKGMFGTYSSTLTDHIWSMGTAYRNHASGTNFGNLYGLAYKHTNNSTGGNMGGGHQMVWVTNGTARGAIGDSGIWTAGYVCGTTCVKSPIVCATTCVSSPMYKSTGVDNQATMSLSNPNAGSLAFTNRSNRVLTSNGTGWCSDGRDPILVLGACGSSVMGNSIGLVMFHECTDDNTYGPIISFANRSNSNNYNTTYAAIGGKKTGQAQDSNWSSGQLHFWTNKVGASNYMCNACMCMTETGALVNHHCICSPIVCATSCLRVGGASCICLTASNPYIRSGGSYIVVPNGIYVSGGTLYAENTIMARNGICDDTAAILCLWGGTSGCTLICNKVTSPIVCSTSLVKAPVFCPTTSIEFGSSNAYINMSRGSFITFYEGGSADHAIGSRNTSGAEADDIRINSYNDFHVNLDSNSNNSNSYFRVGQHGSSTGTIASVAFTVRGDGYTTWSGGNSANANTAYTHSQAAHAPSNANYITNNNQLSNGAGYTTSAMVGTLIGSCGFVTSSGNTIIGTDSDISLSGAGVISSLTMTDGVITAHATRNITLANLGYTGATNANYITNNNQLSNGAGYTTSAMVGTLIGSCGFVTSSGNTIIGTDSDISLSGAGVISSLTMTDGVITAHATRNITLANLGYTGATNANYITNNNQLSNGAGYTTSAMVGTLIGSCFYTTCTGNVVNGQSLICGTTVCGTSCVKTPAVCATACIMLSSGSNHAKMCNSVGFVVMDSTEGLLVRDNSANVFSARGTGNCSLKDFKACCNLHVYGSLSKASGCFSISHPDPAKNATHNLQHAFVESPTEGDNIYRWQVQTTAGTNVITLPTYYRFLNKNDMVWVSPYRNFGSAYGEVTADQCCLIVCSNQDGCYNVLLIGTRKDEHAESAWTGPEVLKPEDEDASTGVPAPVHSSQVTS